LKHPIAVTQKLFEYCRANDWAGYDPYDALNSRIFKLLPFLNFKIFRLVLTQAMKRSPVNIRSPLLISKTHNPKAIALFLMAFVKLSKLGILDQEDLNAQMIGKLRDLRSQNTPYWCWGYSFPWQTRTIMVPQGCPNLVCTVFVANALLDAYELNQDDDCLNMAISAADYILDELYWLKDETSGSLAYPLPLSRTPVHNANFLGAALLCRVAKQSGEERFLEPALTVARYSASKQNTDGSWDYGESSTQHWVDNFHTGYNLCALRSISKYAETSEFDTHIRRGFEFYRDHFFRDDGAPKYFHNRTFPIDIHSVAQSIITLLTFKDLDANNVSLAGTVLKWALTHMLDDEGHFYYQVQPVGTNRIPYMRWAQAWMLLALSSLLNELDEEQLVNVRIGSDA
jgi:hypothetical protein